MKTLKMILFLMIIAFLIMGQESCQSSSTTDEANPFVGGTEGLQVSFDDDRPPEYVESGGTWPFYVTLKLQNKGEAYVEGKNVRIVISGPEPSSFSVNPGSMIKESIEEDIYPVKKDAEGNVRVPVEVYSTFGELNYKQKLDTNFKFNIRADVCYNYYTDARANGCIVRDPTLSETQAYCIVKEEKPIFNSGAPLQITKFEELPAGQDRIKYIFTIEHSDTGGRFFLPNTKCDDPRTTENKIHFSIETGKTELSCTPISGGGMSGDVYLGRDGTIDVTCIQKIAATTDYPDLIKIRLSYDYLQNKETPFMVKAIE
ncbi:MAG: hypothetical protein ABIJ34_05320 [archaeon]